MDRPADGLRIYCRNLAGMGIVAAARLHQLAPTDPRPGPYLHRHLCRPARDCRAHDQPRTHRQGHLVPATVRHHCLWRHIRISLAGLLRHDFQAALTAARQPHDRLWRHVGRRDPGPGRHPGRQRGICLAERLAHPLPQLGSGSRVVHPGVYPGLGDVPAAAGHSRKPGHGVHVGGGHQFCGHLAGHRLQVAMLHFRRSRPVDQFQAAGIPARIAGGHHHGHRAGRHPAQQGAGALAAVWLHQSDGGSAGPAGHFHLGDEQRAQLLVYPGADAVCLGHDHLGAHLGNWVLPRQRQLPAVGHRRHHPAV